MQVGDTVLVIGLPPLDKLPEDVQQVFRNCLNKVFQIDGVEYVLGLGDLHAINVNRDGTQGNGTTHTIYLETEYLRKI